MSLENEFSGLDLMQLYEQQTNVQSMSQLAQNKLVMSPI